MNKSIIEKIKERREISRIKDCMFVFFQIKGYDDSFEAVTEDISQKGLRFKISNFIPKRTDLKLEVYQPLNCNKDLLLSVSAKARIVWIKEVKENSEYLVGAKITRMNEENQNRLSRYVKSGLK